MGIREDIKTVFNKDPAARSTLEVICCYPGLHAIWIHRVSHSLWNRHFYFLARLLSHISRMLTGIEIHPGAKLGRRVFIDHGSGVVIGETAEVGDDVLIYMGVVLGGTALERTKRHPTIESDVVIGSGAAVLGPITVGKGAKIGAGSVVIRPVPPEATVVGVPARIAEPRPVASTGQLDHDKLPDPALIVIGQMLDRLSKLEEQFKAHEELISGHGKIPQPIEVGKEDQIYSKLKEVIDPEVGIDIVKMGFVKQINVNGTTADIDLVLTTNLCPMADYLKDQVRRKVLSVEGIEEVKVNILDEPWSWDRLKQQVVH